MDIVVHVVHVLAALGLIVMVLLQQGKGADAGASFGSGASQTVFGSAGSSNFLTRSTAVLAAVFFITSLTLAWMARHNSSQQNVLPALEQTQSGGTGDAGQSSAPAAPSASPAPVKPSGDGAPAAGSSSDVPQVPSADNAAQDSGSAKSSEKGSDTSSAGVESTAPATAPSGTGK